MILLLLSWSTVIIIGTGAQEDFLGCSSTDLFPNNYVDKLTLNVTSCQRECRIRGFVYSGFRFISNPCGCGTSQPKSLRKALECTAHEWTISYTATKVHECPRNFTHVSKKPYDVCISVFDGMSKFLDCRETCLRKNSDVISDIEKSDIRKALQSFAKSMNRHKLPIPWIGLHRSDHHHVFKWVSKYEAVFSDKRSVSRWNIGYPGTQKCVIFLPSVGLWETKSCQQRHACICQVTLGFSTYVRFRDGFLGVYDRILHFFSNKQNIAMYLVLPIMVVSISSCCVIYGCAKLVEHCKQTKKQRRKMKRKQKRNQVSPDFTSIAGPSSPSVQESCDLGLSLSDSLSISTVETEREAEVVTDTERDKIRLGTANEQGYTDICLPGSTCLAPNDGTNDAEK